MALSVEQLRLILSRAPNSVVRAYREEEIDDTYLEDLGRRMGVIDPFDEVSGRASTKPVREPLSFDMGILDDIADRMEFERQRVGTSWLASDELQDIQKERTQMYGTPGPANMPERPSWGFNTRAGVDAERERLAALRDPANREANEQSLLAREAPLEKALEEIEKSYVDNPNVVSRTFGDIGGSYKSGFSILGGLAGAALVPGVGGYLGAAIGSAPMAEMAYNAAFSEAIKEGLPEEEARDFATTMASTEFLFEMAGGKAVSAIGVGGFVKDQLKKRVLRSKNRAIAGTALAAAAGYGEEAITELGQAATTQKWAQLADNPEFQEFLENQVPRLPDGTIDPASLLWQTHRAGLAGAGMGAGVVAPIKTFEHAAEMGRLASLTEQKVKDAEIRTRLRENLEGDQARTTEIQPTGAEQAQRMQQEDIAWEQRRLEREREANQEDRRISITRRVDTARDRLYEIEERLEDGDTSQATLREASVARRNLEEAETRLSEFEARVAQTSETAQPVRSPVAPAVEATPNALVPVPPETARANDEARKLLQDDAKAVQKKAEAARAADRKKAAQAALFDARSLPEDRREATVAQTLQQWDAANPIGPYLETARTAAPQQGRRGRKPKKGAEAQAQAVQSTKDFLNNTLAALGSQSDTTTGVTPARVGKAIVDTLGNGNSEVAARLLAQGNTTLVSTAEDIPADAVPNGTGGWYDGETTYVVADKLDPDNIVGSLLTTAAHEIKHGGDLAADSTLRTRMGDLLGDDANARIVRRTETLARNADNEIAFDDLGGELTDDQVRALTPAQRVIHMARSTTDNDANYALEVGGYAITEARELQSNNPLKRIADTAIGAARRAIRPVFPGMEITDSDIAYLSDQLLRQTALTNPDLSMADGETAGLSMIAGAGSRGFDEAYRAGKTYLSRDGNRKYWFTDVASRFSNQLPDATKGFTRPLRVIFNHPTLYNEYPQLRHYEVTVKDLGPETAGSFNRETKQIFLNKNLFKIGLNLQNSARRTLLHEIQHAVQDIEGFDGGTSTRTILKVKPEYWDLQGLMSAIRTEIANLGLSAVRGNTNKIATELGVSDKAELSSALSVIRTPERLRSAIDNPSDLELQYTVGLDLLSRLNDNQGTRTGESRRLMESALVAERDLSPKIEALEKEALKTYLSKHGETEARFTQGTANKAVLPSPNPETSWPATWTDEDATVEVEAVGGVPESGASFTGLASVSLPRHIKVENDTSKRNVISRATKRLLFSSGGFPAELHEMMQHGAHQLPAALGVDFLVKGNALNDAISTAARKAKIPEAQYREELTKRIDKIDEMNNRASRQSAIAALNRESPGLGTALNDIREYKLTLSKELINLRMQDSGRDLTEKEIAIYTKFAENQERYSTRAYLATIDKEIGKAWANKVLTAYNTDPTSELGKLMVDALEYLRNNELLIPDAAAMSAMPAGDLGRLYENWTGKVRKKGKNARDQMIGELDGMPPKTQEQVNAKAVEIARGLLGLTANAQRVRTRTTPGAKQNRTILESRTDIPVELRKLMGEITDPFIREALTIQRMQALIAKTKFLNEVNTAGQREGWVSDSESPTHSTYLEDEAYGALQGKWVNQDVADAIVGTVSSLVNLDSSLADIVNNDTTFVQAVTQSLLKPIQGVQKIQKTTNVVMSVGNMAANLIGSPLMAIANGVYNPVDWVTAFRDTIDVLALDISTKKVTPEQAATSRELLFVGVTDSATMGDYQRKVFSLARNELDALVKSDKTSVAKAMGIVWNIAKTNGSFFDALRTVYALMDVWAKVASYKNQKKFLTKYNALEGKGWTEEQIMRRAGYEASGTNISYERAIPLIRTAERNIPFFMFFTYFSETFRVIPAGLAQAGAEFKMAREAKTPEAARLAYRKGMARVAGLSAAVGGVQAMVMSALDSEDEDEKKKRWLDAPWMVDQILVPLGLNKDGKEMFLPIQRFDPIGPMNEFFIGVWATEGGPKEKAQAAGNSIKDMFVEVKSATALAKMMADVMYEAGAGITGKAELRDKMDSGFTKRHKNTAMERNYPKTYEAVRNVFNGWGDLGENAVEVMERLYTPAALRPLTDPETYRVTESREGDLRSPVGDKEPIGPVVGGMALRPYTRDPDKSLLFRKMDYDKVIKRLASDRAELTRRAPNMEIGEITNALLNLREREQEAYTLLQKGYEGYLAFDGKSVQDAYNIIDDKKIQPMLRRGEFQSKILDGAAIRRWHDKAAKEKGADRKALVQQRDLLLKALKETKEAN